MIDLKELQKEVMRNKIEKGFNRTDVALEFCRAYEELSEAFSKFNKDQENKNKMIKEKVKEIYENLPVDKWGHVKRVLRF